MNRQVRLLSKKPPSSSTRPGLCESPPLQPPWQPNGIQQVSNHSPSEEEIKHLRYLNDQVANLQTAAFIYYHAMNNIHSPPTRNLCYEIVTSSATILTHFPKFTTRVLPNTAASTAISVSESLAQSFSMASAPARSATAPRNFPSTDSPKTSSEDKSSTDDNDSSEPSQHEPDSDYEEGKTIQMDEVFEHDDSE